MGVGRVNGQATARAWAKWGGVNRQATKGAAGGCGVAVCACVQLAESSRRLGGLWLARLKQQHEHQQRVARPVQVSPRVSPAEGERPLLRQVDEGGEPDRGREQAGAPLRPLEA